MSEAALGTEAIAEDFVSLIVRFSLLAADVDPILHKRREERASMRRVYPIQTHQNRKRRMHIDKETHTYMQIKTDRQLEMNEIHLIKTTHGCSYSLVVACVVAAMAGRTDPTPRSPPAGTEPSAIPFKLQHSTHSRIY